jgi:hypothetical protein
LITNSTKVANDRQEPNLSSGKSEEVEAGEFEKILNSMCHSPLITQEEKDMLLAPLSPVADSEANESLTHKQDEDTETQEEDSVEEGAYDESLEVLGEQEEVLEDDSLTEDELLHISQEETGVIEAGIANEFIASDRKVNIPQQNGISPVGQAQISSNDNISQGELNRAEKNETPSYANSESKTETELEPVLTKDELDMLLEPMLKSGGPEDSGGTERSVASNNTTQPQQSRTLGQQFNLQAIPMKDIGEAPEKIKLLITQNIKEAQLSVKHEKLGMLNLRVSMNSTSQLSVVINSSTQASTTISAAITSEIREVLERNGLDVTEVELNFSEESNNFREHKYLNGYNDGMKNVEEQETPVTTEKNQLFKTSNLIDIYA